MHCKLRHTHETREQTGPTPAGECCASRHLLHTNKSRQIEREHQCPRGRGRLQRKCWVDRAGTATCTQIARQTLQAGGGAQSPQSSTKRPSSRDGRSSHLRVHGPGVHITSMYPPSSIHRNKILDVHMGRVVCGPVGLEVTGEGTPQQQQQPPQAGAASDGEAIHGRARQRCSQCQTAAPSGSVAVGFGRQGDLDLNPGPDLLTCLSLTKPA